MFGMYKLQKRGDIIMITTGIQRLNVKRIKNFSSSAILAWEKIPYLLAWHTNYSHLLLFFVKANFLELTPDFQ